MTARAFCTIKAESTVRVEIGPDRDRIYISDMCMLPGQVKTNDFKYILLKCMFKKAPTSKYPLQISTAQFSIQEYQASNDNNTEQNVTSHPGVSEWRLY